MYKHPFDIDPFAVVYTAFRNLFPECDCEISWNGEIKDEQGVTHWGVTRFESGKIPEVEINPELTVYDAVEVLAHELAHVANGIDNMQHGPDWEKAFDAIHREYNRVMQTEYPDAVEQYKPTKED